MIQKANAPRTPVNRPARGEGRPARHAEAILCYFADMAIQGWLEAFLARHGGVAGSVHYLRGDQLELAASVNLPPVVIEKTRSIPKGKGMAGLAWERNRTVSTCNLKTDSTGDVRPGAKAVNAGAALAIPVHGGANPGALRAVVGIAFAGERDMSEAEQAVFEQAAEGLPSDA